jgi:Flp pilus assembly protein TadG
MYALRAGLVSRLRRDERGATLLLFTVVLVPLLATVAVGIDFGRALLIKQKLTNAADAAALAVGTKNNLTEEEATALAEAFIHAHYPSSYFGDLKGFSVATSASNVKVTVTAVMPTTFLQVLNTQSLQITANAQVERPQRKLEVALVLDRTGSMAGQRIADLRVAAKDLVDIVVWDNQSEANYAKVAVVPYASSVNVGAYAAGVRGNISPGTCSTPGCQFFKFTNAKGAQKTHQVSSCVSERTGPQAFSDAGPGTALVGPHYPPDSNPCPPTAIVPLTNDKMLLKAEIDALTPVGSTAGHIGIAWGWYLLSPSWGHLWPPGSQPAPYEEIGKRDSKGLPLLQKIIVLMTDGEFNTAYCKGVISKDAGSGSGSDSDHIDCNAPNGSSFTQAESLCGNVKTTGITVFTVGFALGPDLNAREVLARCATDETHAYEASTGDELRQAFRDIAKRIATLRLTN